MCTGRWWLAFGLATTVAINGCNFCGAEEQHAVNVWTLDSLSVVGDGVTRRVDAVSRLTAPPVDRSTVEFVFNTIEGSRSGEGVALSISGTGPTPNELVALTLALPVALKPGDVYTVGATFPIEFGFNTDPRAWGPYDLQKPDQAEVAFATGTYSFPPATFTTTFRAVSTTGTIRVTERESGQLELAVNLTFTDANGKTRSVTSRVHASTESVTPPCLS